MRKVLITPRSLTDSNDSCIELLREAGLKVVFGTPGRQPKEDELVRLLPGCVAYLAGVENISARVLEAARDLKVISRNGTGVDNIDRRAARRLGIRIERAKGANARGVAELTIGLLLATVRSIPLSDKCIKAGGWERRPGVEVRNRVLGLIGCGNVGRIVAQLATNLDMEVLAYDTVPDRAFNPSPQFRYVSVEEVLRRAHVISLHCPPSADGQPLVDEVLISKMRDAVYIINTARAELVANEAVLRGLECGKISGFATDVYEQEPPGPEELLLHDRVVATPHIGGYTHESISRTTRTAVENILKVLG